MVIFLYGEDSYRRRKKLSAIIASYREKHGNLNIERFDPEENVDWLSEFSDFIRNRSIFATPKMAVLDNFDFKTARASDLKDLKRILSASLEEKDPVIMLSSLSSPPTAFGFLLKKPTESEKFGILDKEKLAVFIKKEALERGLEISGRDLKLVAEAFKTDTWAIATELDKLALFYENQPDSKRKKSYYELIGALKSASDPKSRLIALEFLLDDLNEEPARIFNSLPYGNFFFLSRGEWYKKLADYDAAVKSGKLDYAEVLVDLALS